MKLKFLILTLILMLSGCFLFEPEYFMNNMIDDMTLGKTEYGNLIFNPSSSYIKDGLKFGHDDIIYKIDSNYDDFNDVEIHRQINNLGYSEESFRNPYPNPKLNFVYYDYLDDNKDNLRLNIEYKWTSWFFMSSIVFKIGQEKIRYDINSIDRKTEVVTSMLVKEWCYLDIKKDDLDKLLNCNYNELKVRLYGDKSYIDVDFIGYVQNNWKTFYNDFVNSEN